MRTGSVLFPALLLAMGCSGEEPANEIVIGSEGGPSPNLVTMIEKRLSDDPCLSKIATMRREYNFASRDGKLERNLVDVRVQEAGVDKLPAGMYIGAPRHKFEFDDRDYFVAFATYSVSSSALDLWACGDNRAGSVRHEPRF